MIALASLLFGAFYLNDFSTVITSTGRANMVRQFRAIALGTIV